MGCKAGRYKTSTPQGIFIVIPSLEGWPTKAKEAPSPNEVRLALLDTNPAFQSLRGKSHNKKLIVKVICFSIVFDKTFILKLYFLVT